MLLFKPIIIAALLFGAAGFSNHTVNKKSLVPPGKVEGNFTSHKNKESISVIKPKINADGTGCDGKCELILRFSGDHTPPITIEDCIGGEPVNLGDLDGDGKDEIGVLREWFNSCWHNYNVYTFKNGRWQFAVPPIHTYCDQWENGIKAIEKYPLKKGYVKINYSIMADSNIVVKNKIIKVK
ncbi:hypothetical protein LX99_00385 [Mucilaginibacter oryzae]|uniref:VCBS repeat protein n=1 Tax=Mucilaginibacter oryzae TaxID=468058 RepID=A0A316HFE4_9SPHI|nr:hypothetical protein [Mucilaginibacter oryzae]PWK79924.1 hypothetical protein LX99_00385 [Mucilaginibacter oryzae]